MDFNGFLVLKGGRVVSNKEIQFLRRGFYLNSESEGWIFFVKFVVGIEEVNYRRRKLGKKLAYFSRADRRLASTVYHVV